MNNVFTCTASTSTSNQVLHTQARNAFGLELADAATNLDQQARRQVRELADHQLQELTEAHAQTINFLNGQYTETVTEQNEDQAQLRGVLDGAAAEVRQARSSEAEYAELMRNAWTLERDSQRLARSDEHAASRVAAISRRHGARRDGGGAE